MRFQLFAALLGPSIAASVAGCASGPLSALRFENHAPVWVVYDRWPIPKPAELETMHLQSDVEALVRRPVLHALEVPEPRAAMNLNALGEVPNSSWFENRIGVRDVRVEELERGPGAGGIDRSSPWQVKKAKDEVPPRLVVEDARGDKYILKFDTPQTPELETGPEVVVQRLLWAAGYNVPENQIVEFERSALVPADDGERTSGGQEVPLRDADLDAMLRNAARAADGVRFRAVASKYLEGVPVGGYPMRGVRADDANDRVPHQHRRDVRGQKLLFAWLGHTDVKQANTLDTWVERAKGSGRGSLVHHLIDFGKALGVWGRGGDHEHDGYAPHFDYGVALRSMLSLGLWRRPGENVRAPRLRGLGRFEAAHFDPEAYDPANPYEPFLYTDRFDAYWAAKIIARFRPAQIRAAVRQGRYSDPRAERHLTATLIARQRKLLRAVLPQVNAIDEVRVDADAGPDANPGGVRLCARDLTLQSGLVPAWSTRYVLRAYDYDARAVGEPRELTGTPGGALCASGLPLLRQAASHDAYTLLLVRTIRGGRELGAAVVHLARDPASGAPRVIGLERR